VLSVVFILYLIIVHDPSVVETYNHREVFIFLAWYVFNETCSFFDAYKIFILLGHSSFIRFTSPVPSVSYNAGSPRPVYEVCYIEINRRAWE
jgi:hypothetical protein